MSIICPECAHENPAGSEFCDVCGSELPAASAAPRPVPDDTIIIGKPDFEYSPAPDPVDPLVDATPEPIVPPPPTYPAPVATSTATTARLVAKKQGVPTSEFDLESSNLVGKFDPDMGPVEVDLEDFPGAETISRQHSEIYREGDQWKIKDLGSTNGVFLKRVGQTRFSARITTPETLNTGDEIAFGKVNFIFQSP
jgi:hypothetical protein